jgi:hypothetical protein
LTENALLRLLSQVSNTQLLEAFPSHSSSDRSPSGYVPLARIEKKGIEDWAQFPLDTADNIRKWQRFYTDQDAGCPSQQVLGNENPSIRSGHTSDRKRKHLALDGPTNGPFEEHAKGSSESDSPHEHQPLPSSPTALYRAQERPYLHVGVHQHLNINESEHNEPGIVDTGAHPPMWEDKAVATQMASSCDGAPSLNFQQRFLW